MLPQQTLETAAWSASGRSTIKLNRLARQIYGGNVHIAGFECKLDLTITAGGAGVDTAAASMIRAIEDFVITDSLNIELVKLKGHMLRTALHLLTGRLSGGHADPAVLAAAGGAGNARTCRFFIPFVGEGGPFPAGVIGFRKWTDLLQPIDRFMGEQAMVRINWGPAACFNAGTLTAGTLTVTPVLVALPDMHQGSDFRIGWQTCAAGARFDLVLQGAKVVGAAFVNPELPLSHADYTQLNLKDGLLVQADPVERCSIFNLLCVRDAADNLVLTAPEFLPVIFATPNMGITKLIGFGSPSTVQLQTTTTHATDQYMVVAELFDREQLVKNLIMANVGDYARVREQNPKYDAKNGGNATKKQFAFNKLGPARLRRLAAA